MPIIGIEPSEKYRELLGLFSHEYFHSWNVKIIKPEAFIEYNLQEANQTSLLWVFEDFTPYYENAFLLRSKLISYSVYIDIICKKINKLMSLPGLKKQTLAQSSFDARTSYYKQDENSPNSTISYYLKGSIIALVLDSTIIKDSNGKYSLDDVMRFMRDKYGRNFYKGIKKKARLRTT
ncbi:hypothetical protein [Candidatus Kinetoplastidibacterium blastocrithidiae]|uniref:M61 family metallopeptidase n=1 Tax=Candidatus Kinetoplastidibacterium blastocrithidiae TaxID=233181 RepID=UPI0002A66D04|nr:hypothetical protein [Candidatus Kinetoplastibacterium blastocrithidii]AFZ83401.1 hypothetical protein CKBE_00212 [Candidatus Kinetoplastibacterium blastocrithidii (ex Strigomonas culicis)]